MIVRAAGFWLWILDRFSIDGLTMPWGTIYLRSESMGDAELIAHEEAHLAQIERMGAIRFSVAYLCQLARYGYWDMPLEIEARAAASLSRRQPG